MSEKKKTILLSLGILLSLVMVVGVFFLVQKQTGKEIEPSPTPQATKAPTTPAPSPTTPGVFEVSGEVCADTFTVEAPTHMACQDEACVSVDGAGADECENNDDCVNPTHTECVEKTCNVVDGEGDDECENNDDCVNPTHMACQEEACVSVDGAGADECKDDSDCTLVTESHTECKNEACVSVDGAGADECENNDDCVVASSEPTPSPTSPPPSALPEAGVMEMTTGTIGVGGILLILGLFGLLML